MGGLPLRAINEIFRVAKEAPGIADGESATDRIVFRVTDIAVPAYDPAAADTKRITDILKRSLGDDLFAQYLVRLQSDIGVTINQNALNQATGATAN